MAQASSCGKPQAFYRFLEFFLERGQAVTRRRWSLSLPSAELVKKGVMLIAAVHHAGMKHGTSPVAGFPFTCSMGHGGSCQLQCQSRSIFAAKGPVLLKKI